MTGRFSQQSRGLLPYNVPKIVFYFKMYLRENFLSVKMLSKGYCGQAQKIWRGIMFEKGELIMCGGHGVCRVIDITGNPIDRFDQEKKYYVLEPVFEKASTIYTPVDNDKIVMRRIMNKEEAEKLIAHITEIDTVWIQEEKRREQTYKEAIRTYDSRSLVQIIKTLYQRKRSRIDEGKKVLSSDELYLHKAEELLYSEISLALSIPKENVEAYIVEAVDKQKATV